MSEKIISSSYSKRRKKRWPPTVLTAGGDELATVKAAAWAWYQRNEGKPMIREFDLTTRATRTPRPSRYKLEASKSMILSENRVSKSDTDHLSREEQETKFSSLLDPYEIMSISKRIDEGSLPANPTSSFRHGHVLLQKRLEDDSKKENRVVTKMSMKNLWKGMILMAAPRTVCRRSDDVNPEAYRANPRTLKVEPTSVKTRPNRR